MASADDDDFNLDPNGPLLTFALALDHLADERADIADLLRRVSHIRAVPATERYYELIVTVAEQDRLTLAAAQSDVELALRIVSGAEWRLRVDTVDPELGALLGRVNSALADHGLPQMLDIKRRQRPGGGWQNVAILPWSVEPQYLTPIDDTLFRVGDRQTARAFRSGSDVPDAAAPAPAADAAPLVFVSYSTEDQRYLDELMPHLKQLGRSGVIAWHFRNTDPGADHNAAIAEQLSNAAACVLLISQHFFASDYIAEIEIPALLDGSKLVLPIVTRHCDWQSNEVLRNTFMSWGTAPLATLDENDRDAVYTSVATSLRERFSSARPPRNG